MGMPSDSETVPDPGASRPDGPDAPAAGDRYVSLELIGAGAMGQVYAAYDRKLDRKVALKRLIPGHGQDAGRLIREAQAMARLAHPNVVPVFDTGVSGRELFLAMEFIDGTTLLEWQSASGRTWQEILNAYIQAGRGLAAAHAAGIVHRDFKPSNAMVGRDGRVRVTDFGLARAVESEPKGEQAQTPAGAETSPPRALDSPITVEGQVLGTPGYMAPEQGLMGLGAGGATVDARTDQFSFCVALYEALYGTRPFVGADLKERLSAILAGALRPPPKNTSVPTRVFRALERGLSAERDARHPSMEALLRALAQDPWRRRRFWLLGAGGIVVALAGVLSVQRSWAARDAQLCTGGEAEALEVWNPRVQGDVERSLLATGVPYAADTWRRTRGQIDDYMAGWKGAYRSTCEATRRRGEQSEQVMGVRMICLEQRRSEVSALTKTLTEAGGETVSHAVQASMQLSSLDACKDVTSLTAIDPEPTDPAARQTIAAIRQGAAAVKSNIDAGRYRVARDLAEPLVTRARDLGYRPLLAELLLLSATAKVEVGVAVEVRVEARQAASEAERGRADATKARALLVLMRWARGQKRLDEAESWSDLTEAALERSGNDARTRAEWLGMRGMLLYEQGHNQEAVDSMTDSLRVGRSGGVDAITLARLENQLAWPYSHMGRTEDVRAVLEETDKDLVSAVGKDHPSRIRLLVSASSTLAKDANLQLEYAAEAEDLIRRVAPDSNDLPHALNNKCDGERRLHRYAEALADCRGAADAARRLFGPESVVVGFADLNAGEVLLEQNRLVEAESSLDDALKIIDRKTIQADQALFELLTEIGTVRLREQRARESLAPLERALALLPDAFPSGSGDAYTEAVSAQLRWSLAQALWETGARSGRIGDLVRDATQAYRHSGDEDAARTVDQWASSHAIR
jgi:tetratricopeptide (TPR) repeat protein